MIRRAASFAVALLLVTWSVASAQRGSGERYTAVQDGDIVRLTDRTADVVVSILPSVGNIAYEMRVKGQNIINFPPQSPEAFEAKPSMTGIPFMGPWANRLDEQAFYANGRRYPFDMGLGNVRGEIPIHGFVTTTDRWQVVSVRATGGEASVTSRLDFSREPAWMRQWPFAHTVDVTYRLADGVLEVATTVANIGTEPMPIAIGFHPYFQLTDSPRDEWRISVDARVRWKLDARKLPTGETEPLSQLFNQVPLPLRTVSLDDVFGDLIRDRRGRSTMSVLGRKQRIDVEFGPNYRAAVVYAPPGREFICFEPMAGITNAVNMAHKGIYKELQSVAPGATWQESFWIRPSGF
jgi:aldose 1-epimerase